MSELNGLSLRLIESHYENHYGGALRRLNALTEQLESLDVAKTPPYVVNALKREHLEDYYTNTATIEWPLGPNGEAFPIRGTFWAAAVFKDGRNVTAAKEFVRFLVGEGWLAHYLDFAGERMLLSMPKLREGPLWLDPSDPHLMASVMQIASRPMQHDYMTVSDDWRHDQTYVVWRNAAHRVATEGISPEHAVDEAIARIKQILSE